MMGISTDTEEVTFTTAFFVAVGHNIARKRVCFLPRKAELEGRSLQVQWCRFCFKMTTCAVWTCAV